MNNKSKTLKENKSEFTLPEQNGVSLQSIATEKVGVFLPSGEHAAANALVNALNNGGIDYNIFYADNVNTLQSEQISEAVNDRLYSVIIVWAIDQSPLFAILQQAVQAGIKVVAYVEFIKNVQLSYFIGANYKRIGRIQAQYIIDAMEQDNESATKSIILFKGSKYKSTTIADGAIQKFSANNVQYNLIPIDDNNENFSSSIESELQSVIDSGSEVFAICACTELFTDTTIAFIERCGITPVPIITGFGRTDNTEQYITDELQSLSIDLDYAETTQSLTQAITSILQNGDVVSDFSIERQNYNIPASCPIEYVTSGNEEISLDKNEKDDWGADDGEAPPLPPPEEKELLDIKITKSPDKLNYYNYEKFDPMGMIVTAEFSDLTQQVVSDYSYTTDELDPNSKAVTISYTYRGTTKTATIEITMEPRELKNITVTAKKAYFLTHEEIKSSDFIVTAHYDDGNPKQRTVNTAFFSINDLNSTVIENAGIYVAHFRLSEPYLNTTVTKSCDLNITVYNKLAEIKVVTRPKKQTYYKGERFERDGLEVNKIYTNGETERLSVGELTIIPSIVKFANGKEDAQITLTYAERGITKTAELTVRKKNGAEAEDCDVTQDAGVCGEGSVNLSTGKLTYRFDDFTTPDSSCPVTVSHVYKDDCAEDLGVGTGWRLNFHQKIIKQESESIQTYKYIDQRGKEYSFGNGYAEENGRSATRCEKAGLDLYALENGDIKLVDRSNNSLIFRLISDEYRLTEIHNYPSSKESPLAAYSVNISYATDGKISSVVSGRPINGNRARLNFNYGENGLLSSINYGRGNDGERVVAYAYSDGNLISAVKTANSSDLLYRSEIIFDNSADKFIVYEGTQNAAFKQKTIIYTRNSVNGKIETISEGFKGLTLENTSISYTGNFEQQTDETADIIHTAFVNKNGTVTATAFNSYGAVSQYSYEIKNEDHNKPAKINGAQSRGFSYEELAKVYSDTLDLFHDDFEANECSWSGYSGFGDKFISGTRSLCGRNLSKTFTLTSSVISDDTTVYISFWVQSSAKTNITVKVEQNPESAEFTHSPDEVTNKWQFIAFCLGKRKTNDKITLSLSSASTIYLDEVRLTKLPYETPDDIPDNEYDSFGLPLKSYNYNPVNGKITVTECEYNENHLLTRCKTSEDGVKISEEFREYENGLLKTVKRYGKDDKYTKETYSYDENGILSSVEDADGTLTVYTSGDDYDQATLKSADSTDQTQKTVYFANTSVAKEIQSSGYKNAFKYLSDGYLSEVKHSFDTVDYQGKVNFEYDQYHNVKAVKTGDKSLVSLKFDDKHLNETAYANGYNSTYTYDAKHRLVSVTEKDAAQTVTDSVTVTYADKTADEVAVTHSNGVSYTTRDLLSDEKTSESIIEFTGVSRKLKAVGFAANPAGNVSATAYYFDDTNIPFEKIIITKDSYGLTSSIVKAYHGGSTTYSYDSLYRLTGKTTKYSANSPFEVNYTYNTSSGNIVRNSLKQELFKVGSKQDSFAYTYYDNGNVATVNLNGNLQSDYFYDEQNRLIRERNYALGFAREYTYDCGGNISAVKEYSIVNGTVSASPVKTDSYNYSVCTADCGHSPAWKDQLKSYNNQIISYDESGNPLVYFGKNLTWHGRKLKSVNSVNMEYDYNGLRVKKGDKIFFWQNGNLIAERWVESGTEKFIYYYYDESGVSGFRYDNTDYHYQKNIFGDIIAIYTANGQLQCKYVYNAWGEHKIYTADGSILSADSNNIGNLNPIRYRGYYYDEEFALYYLQSRYYDPALGRFISPDSVDYLNPDSVAGMNLYAYCGNNPVMYYDPTGYSLLAIFLILAVGTIAGGAIGAVKATNEGKEGWDFAKSVLLGASIGLAAGGTVVMLIGVGIGFASAFTAKVATFLGTSIAQTFSIGALAFDFTTFVVAPLFGIKMEGVEFAPKKYTPETPKETNKHPYEKGAKKRI